MALARGRRRSEREVYWPGFVDVLTTLLLVVTFLLSLFMLTNYLVTQQTTGKDTMLTRLNNQIAQLTELLALERSQTKAADDNLTSLNVTLENKEEENKRLQGSISLEGRKALDAEGRASQLGSQLDEQKKASANALAQVELVNQQLAALRRQLAALEQALNASESKDKESQSRISDLGKRLNVALARKVQELARYRSDFFGKLRELLGNRSDIQVVGDRFVFQAEVLFDSGQAAVKPEARAQLDKLATALVELEKQIPPDIAWVLRVDGHTDIQPITSAAFASNWDLSAARAIAVVQYLIGKGVSPGHLVAAGFGEFQPVDANPTDDAFRKNRRIELKLTER